MRPRQQLVHPPHFCPQQELVLRKRGFNVPLGIVKIVKQSLVRITRKFNFVTRVIEAAHPSRRNGTGHVPADILEHYA
jgi:hypothetical protein